MINIFFSWINCNKILSWLKKILAVYEYSTIFHLLLVIPKSETKTQNTWEYTYLSLSMDTTDAIWPRASLGCFFNQSHLRYAICMQTIPIPRGHPIKQTTLASWKCLSMFISYVTLELQAIWLVILLRVVPVRLFWLRRNTPPKDKSLSYILII